MNTKSNKENAAYLKKLRVYCGLSITKAAELSDTHYSTWNGWEKGGGRIPGIALAWLNLYANRLDYAKKVMKEIE